MDSIRVQSHLLATRDVERDFDGFGVWHCDGSHRHKVEVNFTLALAGKGHPSHDFSHSLAKNTREYFKTFLLWAHVWPNVQTDG
jgi:hypothetical protein